jgi:hypothetical protein
MKIPLVHNSYQTSEGKDQAFAEETDLLRCHGHQIFLYQGIPAIQTTTVGAGE